MEPLRTADLIALKRLRQDRGLSAADVIRVSGLPQRRVLAIEAGRFEALPPGVYARSAVRAYARAIGLDPNAVIAALKHRLPQAAVDLAVVADLRSPRRPPARSPYLLAAAIDAALLLAIDAAIVYVCCAFCDLPAVRLILAAPVAIVVLCTTPIASYFWLLGATGVVTAGPRLLGVEILPPTRGPLPLNVWFRRGLLYVRQELRLALAVPTRTAG